MAITYRYTSTSTSTYTCTHTVRAVGCRVNKSRINSLAYRPLYALLTTISLLHSSSRSSVECSITTHLHIGNRSLDPVNLSWQCTYLQELQYVPVLPYYLLSEYTSTRLYHHHHPQCMNDYEINSNGSTRRVVRCGVCLNLEMHLRREERIHTFRTSNEPPFWTNITTKVANIHRPLFA